MKESFSENFLAACRKMLNCVKHVQDRENLERIKLQVSKEFHLNRIPRNSDLLSLALTDERRLILERLRVKYVRSASGINIIAVMSAPFPCPHGRCSYCPKVEGVPMSYTGREPSAMRGFQHHYDAYSQVTARLEQLRAIGHEPSKVELVIQGGTFTAMPEDYQASFVKASLDALAGEHSSSLEEAKKHAESAPVRNVGLTIETRPDWAKEPHIDKMLMLGATRVELGIQSLYDDVYKLNKRGHSVDDVVRSFQLLKDAGFKIVAHMMPGLPGSNYARDIEAFKQLFERSEFKPDMLKIYPCLVIKGTEIYEWWRRGDYKPYDTAEAVKIVAEIKSFIPEWIRIMRVQREIPAQLIIAGPKAGNIRELAKERLLREGKRCRCIRCREVGHRRIMPNDSLEKWEIASMEYDASMGREIFLSVENKRDDLIAAYVRLRIPSEKAHRDEIKDGCAIIRELKVCGFQVPVGEFYTGAWQHRGLGRVLLREAERVAAERYDCNKILVLSALGTKLYYRKAGYNYDGPYMSKLLS